jgi:hypothetical protein
MLTGNDLIGQEDLAVGVSADIDGALVEVDFVDRAFTLFYYQAHRLSSHIGNLYSYLYI